MERIDFRGLLKVAADLAHLQHRRGLYAAIMAALVEDRRDRLKEKVES
jgi:hypothetical protein